MLPLADLYWTLDTWVSNIEAEERFILASLTNVCLLPFLGLFEEVSTLSFLRFFVLFQLSGFTLGLFGHIELGSESFRVLLWLKTFGLKREC